LNADEEYLSAAGETLSDLSDSTATPGGQTLN